VNETTKSDTSRTATASRSTSPAKPAAKTFEVEIAGVPLRLKSSHDEQTVKELVRLVDSKIREALPLTKTGSIQNASILASLNLAEEYLMLKRKALSELDGLEAKAVKVITEMESTRSQAAPKTASN
jgi:cell division protein ZapA